MKHSDWESLHALAYDLDPHGMSVLLVVARSLGKVGPRSAELIGDVAARLELGAAYGDWSPNDGRNLASEARDEAVDGVDYTTEELRRAEARVRALKTAQAAFITAHEACLEASDSRDLNWERAAAE